MEHTTTTDIILRWFAGLCIMPIIIFLVFGWLKGLYWERELRLRKKR